jgi:hypothetical protein
MKLSQLDKWRKANLIMSSLMKLDLIRVFEIINKALDSFVIDLIPFFTFIASLLLLATSFSTFFLRKSLPDLL